MRWALTAAHLAAMGVLPFLLVGVINRTKALWSGRKGPRILQSLDDVRRLLRKRPVYSSVTTAVFRVGPLVVLATSLLSATLAPLLGGFAPFSFPWDFVVFAYLWGLGRMALMLSALDTGSSFEGMGASREATYAALVEPGLFLVLGTLAIATGQTSFAEIVGVGLGSPPAVLVTVSAVVALLVVLQVEAARVPVDDPTTHLELTMIHEVMVLDHAGPELAALQYAAALKLAICAGIVAALLNPVDPAAHAALAVAVNVLLALGVAVLVGSVESLIARFRLALVPQYILVAIIAGGVALLTTAWWQGSLG